MSCRIKTELQEEAEDAQIASTLQDVNNFGCTNQIKTEFECNSESLHHSVDLKEVPFELNREEWEDIFIGQKSEELEVGGEYRYLLRSRSCSKFKNTDSFKKYAHSERLRM